MGANGCIVDGPFANFTNNLGPGYRIGDSLNCINRFVNDAVSVMAGQEYLDFCLKKKTYVDFWVCAENAPHRSGHGGVGGKVRMSRCIEQAASDTMLTYSRCRIPLRARETPSFIFTTPGSTNCFGNGSPLTLQPGSLRWGVEM